MDENTKLLALVIIYKLPEILREIRKILFGVIDRIEDRKKK